MSTIKEILNSAKIIREDIGTLFAAYMLGGAIVFVFLAVYPFAKIFFDAVIK
jgi:hypothetical protein